jgi:hypothetical protein
MAARPIRRWGRRNWGPVYVAFIFASHLLSLGLAVYTTRTSGVAVEILLYAFLIDYVLRLGSIQLLHAAMVSARPTFLHAIAPYVSRQPAPRQPSQPVLEREGGPPARFRTYLVVIAFMSGLAFVLMHVNADKEISLAPDAALRDLLWALVIGSIYWINSLLTRTMVIRPSESLTRNFGYNTKEVIILSLAVLTGGAVVAVRQGMDLGPSGWTVMGPLLFFRFLYDLWASLDAMPDRNALLVSK